MQFRKKPVLIEAYRAELQEQIETLEGVMTASPGDWVITGVKGERYPCKPDVFERTYDPVGSDAEAAWREAYAGEIVEEVS